MNTKDLISQIIGESRHYESFSDIEKLVESGDSLENIPLQPLYHALQGSSAQLVAQNLTRLSPEQRKAMVDLDFWKKDVIDVKGFEYWLGIYSSCQEDEIIEEFVLSDEFLLYLKSRVNIWTFDVEDPQYPEHDYYFLTDDSLLLVEYSEGFTLVSELKQMIQYIYSYLGAENAYSMLFKLINDNFSSIQEKAYEEKIDRLRDYGIPDYFEATAQLFPFKTTGAATKYVQSKRRHPVGVDNIHLNQKLSSAALVAFEKDNTGLGAEILKVKDEVRWNF